MRRPYLILIPLLVSVAGAAVDRDAIMRSLYEQLHAEELALAEMVQAKDAERLALLMELREEETALSEARRQWEMLQAKQRGFSDPSLKEPLAERIAGVNAAARDLEAFSSTFAQSLHPAEMPLAKRLREFTQKPAAEAGNLPEVDDAHAYARLVSDALDRLERLAGGSIDGGHALFPDGRVESGEILQVGPLALFKPEADKPVGWINGTVSGEPSVAQFFPPNQEALKALFEQRRGEISVPANMTMPRPRMTGFDLVRERISNSGVWVYPILAFALIATLSAIYKGLHLRAYKVPSREQMELLMLDVRRGAAGDVEARLASFSKPVRRLVLHGMEMRRRNVERIEPVLVREAHSLYPTMSRFLPFIGITASIAPLLGLLGTVSGMIRTFDVISVHGTRNAQLLSGGIAEALGTTEMGLVVAIPALILYTLLSRRVKTLMNRYDRIARETAEALRSSREWASLE